MNARVEIAYVLPTNSRASNWNRVAFSKQIASHRTEAVQRGHTPESDETILWLKSFSFVRFIFPARVRFPNEPPAVRHRVNFKRNKFTK